jgi:cyclohexadieny/prephenate dehydrogenase
MSQRIAIIGLGLIGSSLARALVSQNADIHIAAFDLSHDALSYAVKEGFAHSQHAHAGQAASGTDMVVLATPPSTLAAIAGEIAPFIGPEAVVTDVASVKCHAVNAIVPHMPRPDMYVPAHPIAGSELSGIRAGRADLFAGKRVILTPEEDDLRSENVARVCALWESVGAKIEYMPADIHDRIYAYVSHLPQIIAFAAAQAMKDLPTADPRFTRLMKSDPVLWADICVANADPIGDALENFAQFASQMAGELTETPPAKNPDGHLAVTLFSKVIATCLIASAATLQETMGVHPARYAGSGFTDMTSPATSDPESALAAISDHNGAIASMLRQMLARLDEIKKRLKSGDRQALENSLRTA